MGQGSSREIPCGPTTSARGAHGSASSGVFVCDQVVVWDPQPSRLANLTRLVQECDGVPVRFDELRDVQSLAGRPACSTAVLGGALLESGELGQLGKIRELKAAGFGVICYQDGSGGWPLGVQCRAFLAGCSHLLDSRKADFEQLLREALTHRLQEAAARATEERRLRSAMAEHGIVGDSDAMLGVFRLILRIATLSEFPVLITGESGTGKELLANAIHRLDASRRNGPFVPVNCAAITRELAESEFFGHRRGAFTGADRDRKGLFRAADGGVLFLDEIAELDERLQTKLLRVLQEQRVLGIGDELETAVNVRVIAATNADLQETIRRKQFRADLFNRLNTLAVHIPPLRERPCDIRLLAEHFLARFSSLCGGAPLTATEEFMNALMRLELAGNARQLENLIRWVLLNKAERGPLSLGDLPRGVWEQLSRGGAPQPGEYTDATAPPLGSAQAAAPASDAHVIRLLEANGWSMSRSIADCERLMLQAALERERGNQSRTARLLGITPRSVYNKLRKHSLHP